MADKEFKPIKFDMNEVYEVELSFDQPVTTFSERFQKNSYWYGIKDQITGENGFNATEKLHEKIQGLGAGSGDVVSIKKESDGKITYFVVSGQKLVKGDGPKTNTTGGDVLTKDINPPVPNQARLGLIEDSLKKLNDRLKEVEQWKDSLSDNKDDDVPF